MTQDTNTLLASLVEKMEGEKKDPLTYLDPRKPREHNAAIDQCITIIKEAMK